MEKPLSVTGGARIGWFNSGWPCARLTVTPDRLTVSALFVGTYHFTPAQIFAFEKVGRISPALRIIHTRDDISGRCIFMTLSGPEKLARRIRDAGFIPAAQSAPQARGVPFRWSSIIAIVILWNLLGLLSLLGHRSLEPHPVSLIPLGIMSFLSISLLWMPSLHPLIMRPGRHFEELRPLIFFLSFLITALFFSLALFFIGTSLLPLPE